MHNRTTPRRPLPPAVLDPALGPATRNHTGTTAVLACLTAATQKRIAPHHAQQWLNDRRPDLTRHVNNPHTWARLVAVARDRVKQTETLSGRRELARVVLARTLAHALSSFPWIDKQGELISASPRAVNTARAALLHLGVSQVKQIANPGPSGQPAMDALLVVLPRLACRLGVTRATARSAVRLLVQAGALVHVKQLPMGGRYRLGRVQDRAFSALLDDTIEATLDRLFDDREDPPLPALDVQAILTAGTHPVFAFPDRAPGSRRPTELDLTARLVLIADAVSGESGLVHVDPVTDWGVSAAGVRNARTLLMRTGCYDPDADLGETLTTYGRATGALARAAEAERERAAAAAQQVDAVTAARERAKKARAIIKKALRAAQAEVGVTVPGPDDPAELRPTWARLVRAELAGVDQGLRAAVRRELVRRLTRAGHPDREARAVADRLAPDEPHPAAAA